MLQIPQICTLDKWTQACIRLDELKAAIYVVDPAYIFPLA